jgi:REP element-mobilizing transposase RayT
MPVKNRVKNYLPRVTYHIYNRGIDGREIFGDEADYEQFVQILGKYLVKPQPVEETIYKKERPYLARHREMMNLADEVELMALCLMPDHLHLLIWQKTADGMEKLMRRVATNYVMHYNRKYKRSGPLFENVYRAVVVPDGETAVWMSKYIHLNPVSRQVRRYGLVETVSGSMPGYYMYSSYKNYLGEGGLGVDDNLINTKRIIGWFGKSKLGGKGRTYRKFVEEPVGSWQEVLGGLLLE